MSTCPINWHRTISGIHDLQPTDHLDWHECLQCGAIVKRGAQ